MRIVLNTKINKSIEEDLRNLNLLLEEHSSDYNLNPFTIKMANVSLSDDTDLFLATDQVVDLND